jgi:hypothetical protein
LLPPEWGVGGGNGKYRRSFIFVAAAAGGLAAAIAAISYPFKGKSIKGESKGTCQVEESSSVLVNESS